MINRLQTVKVHCLPVGYPTLTPRIAYQLGKSTGKNPKTNQLNDQPSGQRPKRLLRGTAELKNNSLPLQVCLCLFLLLQCLEA